MTSTESFIRTHYKLTPNQAIAMPTILDRISYILDTEVHGKAYNELIIYKTLDRVMQGID